MLLPRKTNPVLTPYFYFPGKFILCSYMLILHTFLSAGIYHAVSCDQYCLSSVEFHLIYQSSNLCVIMTATNF